MFRQSIVDDKISFNVQRIVHLIPKNEKNARCDQFLPKQPEHLILLIVKKILIYKRNKAFKNSESLVSLSRGEKTRTSDPLHPMQVR
jgi:hypothetical protein